MKGATTFWLGLTLGLLNFNPRSRERERLTRTPFSAVVTTISIHAPVKGATKAYIGMYQDFVISIHAPVKGATAKKGIDNFKQA